MHLHPRRAVPPVRTRRVAAFFRRFLAHDPRGVALDFTLTVVLAALQGFGILLLVPLLAYVGVADGPGGGPVTTIAAFFFEDLGLPRSLPVILVLYVSLVAARHVLERRHTLLDARLQLGFSRSLRVEVHRALLQAEWRFLAGSRRSDFVQILTHDTDRAGHAAALLLKITTTAALLLVYLAVALRLSPMATLATVAATAVPGWLLRGKLTSSRAAGADVTGRSNRLYAEVLGHLDGMTEIRSYNAEARSMASFEEVARRLDDARVRFFEEHSGARLWMNVGGVATLAGLLLVAVEVLRLPTASLLLLVYLFARMLPQANQVQSQLLSFLHALPAFEAVDALVQEARDAAEAGDAAPAARPERAIAFEDVAFAHRPGRPTVTGLRFTIPVRRTTAIVGASGAGKTTTALLLMGLLVPDEGRILVDGEPLVPGARRAWRARIGYVPQETFLLHDTLRANLLLSRPEAEEDDLWQALELAAADGFVRGLPEGLDTVVGDRGLRLSGGERQRIALARALLPEPDLLVLDEATSSLDMANERRIFEALDRLHGRLTIVLITHRMGSLDHVDGIVAMEAGRMVESAPPAAALRRRLAGGDPPPRAPGNDV